MGTACTRAANKSKAHRLVRRQLISRGASLLVSALNRLKDLVSRMRRDNMLSDISCQKGAEQPTMTPNKRNRPPANRAKGDTLHVLTEKKNVIGRLTRRTQSWMQAILWSMRRRRITGCLSDLNEVPSLWEAKSRIPKGFAKSSHFRQIIGL